MRLLIAEKDHTTYDALLQDLPGINIVSGSQADVLAPLAAGADIWLGSPALMVDLLEQGLRPKWLQTTWAGIAPLLRDDLPRDYRLSRAVGVFGQVMSEYLLTYLLAHERKVLLRAEGQREGHWGFGMPGSLAGRHLLIVGAGEIGVDVAAAVRPFGITCDGIASRPRTLEGFGRVGGVDNLAVLATAADYVLNLLPDTAETRDLYDASFFQALRPHALFINAGRGTSVVDQDLVHALQQGWLAGAVIDVCREEPPPVDHPFWTAPNLLLTGHSAAPTLPPLLARLFRQNLQRWQNGEALLGEVDFARGY